MSRTRTIISASIDNEVLVALDKYAKCSPYSRSTLLTIAAAQLVGVPYEPPVKKGDEEDE